MFAVKFSGIDSEAALNHFCQVVGVRFGRTDIEFDSDWDKEKNIISYSGETEYDAFCEMFCAVALDILQNEVEFSMEAAFVGEVKARLFVRYEDSVLAAEKEMGSQKDEADFDVEDGYIAADCGPEELSAFFKA